MTSKQEERSIVELAIERRNSRNELVDEILYKISELPISAKEFLGDELYYRIYPEELEDDDNEA